MKKRSEIFIKRTKILFVMAIACLFFAMSITFIASTKVNVAKAEEVENVVVDETITTEETRKHTFSERISEWFSINFLEVVSTTDFVSTAICIVMVVLEKRANKKHKIDIKTKINGNSAIIEASNTVNNKVIEVVNQLIEKQNILEIKEADRDKLLTDVMTFNKAIIEILMSVYANNKNIPQAIKDLINIKYVQALKKENLIKDTTSVEEKQEIVEE